MNLTNKHDIPLLLAVWLLNDTYDYVNDPNYISATSLMKPIKQLLLSRRVAPSEMDEVDLSDLIARSLGNAIHDAVDNAWKGKNLARSLQYLGISPETVEVNPETPDPAKNQVWIEKREFRKILGYTVGGKYDAIIQGIVHDTKSTSAWAWVKGTRDEDFIIQGSIYRWLNPEKITEDFIRVCFVFTDWQKGHVGKTEGYPDARAKYKDLPLWSIEETEQWIRKRLQIIERLKDSDEVDMPLCTDEEVWLAEPSYRYYSNPAKTDGRATRVFKDPQEAQKHFTAQGKGIIITTPPVAKRCKEYCEAFSVCKQKDNYDHE